MAAEGARHPGRLLCAWAALLLGLVCLAGPAAAGPAASAARGLGPALTGGRLAALPPTVAVLTPTRPAGRVPLAPVGAGVLAAAALLPALLLRRVRVRRDPAALRARTPLLVRGRGPPAGPLPV